MSFEIKAKDVMGRIGLLKTRRGVIETPYMYPVINPVKKTIPLDEIKNEFKMNAVITNAYLVKKYFNETAIAEGVHKILDFEDVIMTDSGAYQLLIYGKVEVTPKEIVEFQEKIGSDIAVILDYPTGGNATKKMAEETVKVTIERAIESEKYRTDDTILWVGPIQGGTFLDLIAYSAKQMSKLNFDIFALGSPTQIMERYEYDTLVDMIVTAKMNLPPNKPLHLFGGGHPMIFAFAVALGVDLFDSASYALYARADRYITPTGTIKLTDLHESICNCPICRRYPPDELKTLPKEQREKLLARHNLYVTILELNRIKQAIREGRLWEYMAMKARAHPKLLGALKRIKKYAPYIEQFDPVTKKRALFYTGPEDSYRPEVIRHREYLKNYIPPLSLDIGVLIDFYALKNKKSTYYSVAKALKLIDNEELLHKTHLVLLSPLFGPVPLEISSVYPLYQYEIPDEIDLEILISGANSVIEYLKKHKYRKLYLLLNEQQNDWLKPVIDFLNENNIPFEIHTNLQDIAKSLAL